MRFLHWVLGISRLLVKMTTEPSTTLFSSCSNCIHFIPKNQTTFSTENQCRKYSDVDISTGIIRHSNVIKCRRKEDYCGFDGKDYEPRNDTETMITIVPDEKQMVNIRYGLFVCHFIFHTLFWITLGECLYLSLWM